MSEDSGWQRLHPLSPVVRAGRGTLGGLLEDPTIYEETKRMLVSINRNAIMKSLVRFVIRRRDVSEVPAGDPDAIVVHPRGGPRQTGEARSKGPRNE